MDIKSEIDKYIDWHSNALQLIKNMLLYDRMRIEEIPQVIRITDTSVYVTAIRVANGISCKRLIETFDILCEDIRSIDKDTEVYRNLSNLLSHYLHLNNYREEEDFVNYKENVCTKVLCEMYGSSEPDG